MLSTDKIQQLKPPSKLKRLAILLNQKIHMDMMRSLWKYLNWARLLLALP
jgi:hypothetical protein